MFSFYCLVEWPKKSKKSGCDIILHGYPCIIKNNQLFKNKTPNTHPLVGPTSKWWVFVSKFGVYILILKLLAYIKVYVGRAFFSLFHSLAEHMINSVLGDGANPFPSLPSFIFSSIHPCTKYNVLN